MGLTIAKLIVKRGWGLSASLISLAGVIVSTGAAAALYSSIGIPFMPGLYVTGAVLAAVIVPLSLLLTSAAARLAIEQEAVTGRVHALSRELSDHGRIQDVLVESEERFRRIFEDSIIGFVISDPDGAIRLTNRATQKLLGFDADELLGMNVKDITHPDDQAQLDDASHILRWIRVVSGKTAVAFGCRLRET